MSIEDDEDADDLMTFSRDEKTAPAPPEVIGPPEGDECERCRDEPAEHRVRLNWSNGPPEADLCGTCFLVELRESGRTYQESYDYWSRQAAEDDR
jgi:hypothetical protein